MPNLIVPWTTPGQTPCCCEDNSGSPGDVFAAPYCNRTNTTENFEIILSKEDATALSLGGTATATFSASFTETWSLRLSASTQIYFRSASASGSVTQQFSGCGSGSISISKTVPATRTLTQIFDDGRPDFVVDFSCASCATLGGTAAVLLKSTIAQTATFGWEKIVVIPAFMAITPIQAIPSGVVPVVSGSSSIDITVTINAP